MNTYKVSLLVVKIALWYRCRVNLTRAKNLIEVGCRPAWIAMCQS